MTPPEAAPAAGTDAGPSDHRLSALEGFAALSLDALS